MLLAGGGTVLFMIAGLIVRAGGRRAGRMRLSYAIFLLLFVVPVASPASTRILYGGEADEARM